ncbi:MAG: helix-turn-helix transcriptional regulator [Pseudomonadales bacterium]|nr:helix-turn-helix transcriptional regulator [Pseudomonadales bacterium]
MSTPRTTFSAVLGVVLCNIRLHQAIEQAEIAERMGLSQASYSRLENGKAAFSVDQMYQAADALGITGEEISRNLNSVVRSLIKEGIEVVPQVRGNSGQAKDSIRAADKLLRGSTLSSVLIGILGNS